MIENQLCITGIGTVSPFGPLQGLIARREIQPRMVNAWPVEGVRRAFLVEPFRPADVVPGLKTRRLDRLSVWCLVAAALAVRDARLNLEALDLEAEERSRIAVVLGTGFGCVELTESFFQGVCTYGYAQADPIIFPESLHNAPSSHVARILGLRGPNITLTHKGMSGEGALIQASALLRTGQADAVIVLAGDTLTRPIYEWLEAASVLSKSCFGATAPPQPFAPERDGFVPGEGVAAVVMESGRRAMARGAPIYAVFRAGFSSSNPEAAASVIRKALSASTPDEVGMVIASANGSRLLDDLERATLRKVFGDSTPIVTPKTVLGEFDGSGILRLVIALSWVKSKLPPLVLLLATSPGGACAAISCELR